MSDDERVQKLQAEMLDTLLRITALVPSVFGDKALMGAAHLGAACRALGATPEQIAELGRSAVELVGKRWGLDIKVSAKP